MTLLTENPPRRTSDSVREKFDDPKFIARRVARLRRLRVLPPACDVTVFLQDLRPGGPWVLLAFHPEDGPRECLTTKDPDEVRAFVARHDGKHNIYYSLNRTRKAMNKKPAKADIAVIECLHGDLDPRGDESPDEAKKRYFAALKSFDPQPSAIIDSGNGLQCLWKLQEPIVLPEDAPDQCKAVVDQAEATNSAIMTALGCDDQSTKNIDRILRLPGTTNIPNKKKRDKGRVKCPSKVITSFGPACSLDDFRVLAAKTTQAEGADLHSGAEGKFKSRSEKALSIAAKIRKAGGGYEAMKAAICEDPETSSWYHEKGVSNGERELKRIFDTTNKAARSGKILRMLLASEVVPEPVTWLWRDWLAKGKLHILAGQPGDGKSTIAFEFAAVISCGGCWPDGHQTQARNVIIWSGEDTPADTIVPRLTRMGADLGRIHFIADLIEEGVKRAFDPATDMDAVRRAALPLGDVGLIIIDPIASVCWRKGQPQERRDPERLATLDRPR